MKIHIVASESHYRDHLLAIWKHLPDELRGYDLYGRHARLRRIDAVDDEIVMVAGLSDVPRAAGRKVILVEHGAAQRYVGLSERMAPYYGGPWPSNVVAYLGPRQEVVDVSGLPGHAMGSPICDAFELFTEQRTAVITWHWRGKHVCPETDSALYHYIESLPEIIKMLRSRGFHVLGHRHPRLIHPVNLWPRLGVEEVDAATARREAWLLIADNTSFAYECAYLARNVIMLNQPAYRRDVEHGLRFWSAPPGPMVDDPGELLAMIDSIDDFEMQMTVQRAIGAEAAYGMVLNNGHDGMRAAAWVAAFTAQLAAT